MREVWITGMGAVTGSGLGTAPLADALRVGRSAVRRQASGPEWAAPVMMPETGREAKRLDRSAQLFLAAAQEAWAEAGLQGDRFDPFRIGLFEGSSLGPMGAIIEESRCPGSTASPARARRLARLMTGAGGATFAQTYGIRGPVLHLSAGSVASAAALGEGFWQVATGRLDLVVAGGGEATLHPDVAATFRVAGILGASDDWPCRPFDRRRNGTVLGEGAGAFVLEAAEHARRRGAERRATVLGYACVTESHGFVAPDPDGTGVSDAARAALEIAGRPRLAWIKAHGTGTLTNDLAECRGLSQLLGPVLETVPLTSLKSTVGHCLGASAAIEAAGAMLAMRDSIVPATVGTEEPDPALPPCRVATEPIWAASGAVLLLAESFGGRCAALVIE